MGDVPQGTGCAPKRPLRVGYTYCVEKERAPESVAVFTYERSIFCRTGGFSPIFITAALSVLLLLSVAGWEIARSVTAQNTNAPLATPVSGQPFSASAFPSYSAASTSSSTSTDPLSSIGPTVMNELENAYVQLQAAGEYSSSTAAQAGSSLAPYISADVQYPAFTPSDIKTDPDTSYARMLQYRSDLRISLAPLLKNTTPEFTIFAEYVQTGNASYLQQLRSAAADYQAAASSTARLVVPADALQEHVGILNAMEEFAATLEALATHADDPFASAALLQTYDNSENDVRTSFNALIAYEKEKQQ